MMLSQNNKLTITEVLNPIRISVQSTIPFLSAPYCELVNSGL